uniref:Uncharacterized protein n=1 Tax=Plectus sambesii TaxID=2011161 RepID=A0A914VBF6_9BILA
MTNYTSPTYELLLNTTDDQSQNIELVQVGAGESFKMKCIVIGEYHENHDLSWSKNGRELAANDSLTVIDSPPGSSLSKSIAVTSFNEGKHAGRYECTVKRKNNASQSGSMRLEQKPGSLQIPDTYTTCPKERDGMCLNGGICMMHNASGDISCLCWKYKGPNCERKLEEIAPISRSDLHGTQAALWIMPVIILALLVLVFLCSRQNKKLKRKIKKLRKSSCPDPESNPLSNWSDLGNVELLPQHQSIIMQDEENCQNGESSQFNRDGSTSTTPSAASEATSSHDLSNQTESISLTPHNKKFHEPIVPQSWGTLLESSLNSAREGPTLDATVDYAVGRHLPDTASLTPHNDINKAVDYK